MAGDTMNQLSFVIVFDHPHTKPEDNERLGDLRHQVLDGPLGVFPHSFSTGGHTFQNTMERWVTLYTPDPLPQTWFRHADKLVNAGHIDGYRVLGQVEPLPDVHMTLRHYGWVEEAARKVLAYWMSLPADEAIKPINRDNEPLFIELCKALGV